jgi:hypothetical protein
MLFLNLMGQRGWTALGTASRLSRTEAIAPVELDGHRDIP